MDEIEFIYQVSEYDAEQMLPHVSKALEKRLKIRQQQMLPARAARNLEMTEAEKKKQKTQKMIRGILLLILGALVLLVYMQKQPDSKLMMYLGIVCLVWGAFSLLGLRTPKGVSQEKYDAAAREFLEGNLENIKGKQLQVCFSDEEMVIVTGALEDLDQDPVEYKEIEMVAEGEDFFFMTFQGRGSILQKKDLTLGAVDEFRKFIMSHVENVFSLNDEEQVASSVEEETVEESEEE